VITHAFPQFHSFPCRSSSSSQRSDRLEPQSSCWGGSVWRPSNFTPTHSLTVPEGQPFASCLGGQRFAYPGCTNSQWNLDSPVSAISLQYRYRYYLYLYINIYIHIYIYIYIYVYPAVSNGKWKSRRFSLIHLPFANSTNGSLLSVLWLRRKKWKLSICKWTKRIKQTCPSTRLRCRPLVNTES
jgi:hypothetical protein